MIFVLFLYLAMMAFALGMLGIWIWMIVDVATREREGNDRLVWLLVVLLAGGIGALIYLFARKLPRDRARPATTAASSPPPAPAIPLH